jgi:hypothetical protein
VQDSLCPTYVPGGEEFAGVQACTLPIRDAPQAPTLDVIESACALIYISKSIQFANKYQQTELFC